MASQTATSRQSVGARHGSISNDPPTPPGWRQPSMNVPSSQRERAGPVTVFQNQRVLMVRNLRPGLPERGKIKIGVKGEVRKSKGGNEFQPPQKLDHFVI